RPLTGQLPAVLGLHAQLDGAALGIRVLESVRALRREVVTLALAEEDLLVVDDNAQAALDDEHELLSGVLSDLAARARCVDRERREHRGAGIRRPQHDDLAALAGGYETRRRRRALRAGAQAE